MATVSIPNAVVDELVRRVAERHARVSSAGALDRWRIPKTAHIRAAVDTAFSASITKEEGIFATGTLFVVNSLDELVACGWSVHPYAEPRPLSTDVVAKLSPAQKLGRNFLVVEAVKGLPAPGLAITASGTWPRSIGQYRALTTRPVSIVFSAPGTLVLSTSTIEDVRFSGGQVIAAEPSLLGVELQDERRPVLLDELRAHIAGDKHQPWMPDGWIFRLVAEIRQIGRGAILAFPDDDEDMRATLHGAPYAFREPIPVGALIKRSFDAHRDEIDVRLRPEPDRKNRTDAAVAARAHLRARHAAMSAEREALDRLTEVARLSAVDCAVTMAKDLSVTAHGIKLATHSGRRIELFRPDPMSSGWVRMDLSHRGSRHTSAVRWVDESMRRGAIIVSQDGEAAMISRVQKKLVYFPINRQSPWFMGPPGARE